MKNRGISIVGIIVFLGLLALIVWGLDYIITKDFVVVRTPTVAISNNNTDAITATTTPAIATSTVSTPTNVATTNQPATSTISNPPTSSSLTVTLTDKGFSPASLTIKKGQTVTFVNNSSGKMWVAANPFPTSSEYPAFNEKSGIENGSSWSFTFDKSGVWFYHNHFNPPQGAKIVVNAK